jgi:hypothetical protein
MLAKERVTAKQWLKMDATARKLTANLKILILRLRKSMTKSRSQYFFLSYLKNLRLAYVQSLLCFIAL